MSEQQMTPEELQRTLASRQWPPQRSHGDFWKALRANEPRVRKGRVFNRELRLYMGVSEPIAPGESAISALATAGNGHVYGVTRGTRAHLFFYCTEPLGDAVVEVQFFDGVQAAGNALVPIGDTVYGGVSDYDPEAHDGGFLFVHETEHDTVRPYHAFGGGAERLATPVPGEGIATLAAAASGKALVGISTGTAAMFAYHIESQEVRRLDWPVGAAPPCPVLASGLDGRVYGVTCQGQLFRADAESWTIEAFATRLPRGTGLSCRAVDPVTGVIYFGSEPDGALVALDPATLQMRDLGTPPPVPPIRAMTVGQDGHVYGAAGPRDNLALAFEADPLAGTIEKLGVLMATSERYWHGYEFDAAATGRHGEIYFGEADRISHLFMYFPPQPRR